LFAPFQNHWLRDFYDIAGKAGGRFTASTYCFLSLRQIRLALWMHLNGLAMMDAMLNASPDSPYKITPFTSPAFIS
jgi:hypothetical protein